jgi:NIMA (never in mitosis gene a)-related kinase
MRVLKSIDVDASACASRQGTARSQEILARDTFTASTKLDAGEALKEAEVLRSLSHPNVIGYYDAFCTDSCLCIVMEYANGGDLAAAIARRRDQSQRYHERDAMVVFAQLARALQHVHERRILHRDLKSQNVFLTTGGVVKLGDFGIAKKLTPFESHAHTWVGTPLCVPPEVCDNSPYDFKADVWGLGVVLYEILALECPFQASNLPALAMKICTAEPRPVPSVYSPEVRQLLSKLLAKCPLDRPDSEEIVAMPHVRRAVCITTEQRSSVSMPTPELRLDSKPRNAAFGIAAQCERAVTGVKSGTVGVVGDKGFGIDDSFDLISACKAFSFSSSGSKGSLLPTTMAGGALSATFKKTNVGAAQCLSPGSPPCGASPGSRGSISDLISFFLEGADEFDCGKVSIGTSPLTESPITALLGELEQDFGLM